MNRIIFVLFLYLVMVKGQNKNNSAVFVSTYSKVAKWGSTQQGDMSEGKSMGGQSFFTHSSDVGIRSGQNLRRTKITKTSSYRPSRIKPSSRFDTKIVQVYPSKGEVIQERFNPRPYFDYAPIDTGSKQDSYFRPTIKTPQKDPKPNDLYQSPYTSYNAPIKMEDPDTLAGPVYPPHTIRPPTASKPPKNISPPQKIEDVHPVYASKPGKTISYKPDDAFGPPDKPTGSYGPPDKPNGSYGPPVKPDDPMEYQDSYLPQHNGGSKKNAKKPQMNNDAHINDGDSLADEDPHMDGDSQNGDSQNGDSQNGDSQNGDSHNGGDFPNADFHNGGFHNDFPNGGDFHDNGDSSMNNDDAQMNGGDSQMNTRPNGPPIVETVNPPGDEDAGEDAGFYDHHPHKAKDQDSDGMQPPPNDYPNLPKYVEKDPYKYGYGQQYYPHHYDHHHVYHEIAHTTTTTTEAPKEARVNKGTYSYYYLGRKLWYVPLYFSVYFIVYITVLILKSIARHKVNFVQNFDDRHSRDVKLDESSAMVDKAVSDSMNRYIM